MKTFVDDADRISAETHQPPQVELFDEFLLQAKQSKSRQDAGKDARPARSWRQVLTRTRVICIAMIGSLFLLDAVLPLRSLWFHEVLLTQLGSWPVLPSLLLFPGWKIIPPLGNQMAIALPSVLSSWGTLGLLLCTFLLVFLTYIVALRHLPPVSSRRFIMRSTLLLGLLYTLIPVVTSLDIFSYIAYARSGILYHFNPMTATPLDIRSDIIYRYVAWVDQPSAYGPTWTLLTCLLQYILAFCNLGSSVLAMVGALRLLGLAMHLGSVALIWSLSGSLQREYGVFSEGKRRFATLAFAWNPLLLLEACTNAHNDTTMLFLLLAAIWFLMRRREVPDRLPDLFQRLKLKPIAQRRIIYFAPAVFLALGICLKINLLMLAPGLFFYQWLQEEELPMRERLRRIARSVGACFGTVVALYAPFWQGGAILHVFEVNPATERSVNTLSHTLSQLYNGVVTLFGFSPGAAIGSPSEHLLHTLSMCLFVVIYAAIGWQVLQKPDTFRTVTGLVRWCALIWLCYCSVGSPWYWPWYVTTFLGLYALLEALPEKRPSVYPAQRTGLWQRLKSIQAFLLYPGTVRTLTFSMLTLYCFTTWATQHSFVPGLTNFPWASFGGAWAWLLPLLYFKRATTTYIPLEAPKKEALPVSVGSDHQ